MTQLSRIASMILAILVMHLIPGQAVMANGTNELGITLPTFQGNYDFAVANLGALNARGRTTSLVKLPGDAKIVAAFVYGSGYSDLTRDQLGKITLNFKNKTDNTTTTSEAVLIGYAEIEGKNYFAYRADVTQAVAAGPKTYRLNGFTLPATPQEQGGFFGVGLLVIYEKDNLPQAQIVIADGLDYLGAAAGEPATSLTTFKFPAQGFAQSASVKLFAAQSVSGGTQQWFNGSESESQTADAVWYQAGSGNAPSGSLIDVVGAVDLDGSSQANAATDTDPLSTAVTRSWATLEFSVPLEGKDSWIALQLESQQDKQGADPFEGVWTMAATRVAMEDAGCGSIGDLVYYDRDGDGVQSNSRERGIPGVTVRLYADDGNGIFNQANDTLIDTTLTNELGYYEFRYLDLGVYFIEIDHERLDPQYVSFTNRSNPTDAIILDACEPRMDIDFGLTLSGLPGGGSGPGSGFGSGFDFGGNGGGFDFGGNGGGFDFGGNGGGFDFGGNGGGFDFGGNGGGFDFSGNGGGFDFGGNGGNFDFGNGGGFGGFNFGGGGFFGGFGQTLPVELSQFQIIDSEYQVSVAYLALDSQASTFQVYRSTDRYENYQQIPVTLLTLPDEDRVVFTDNNVRPGDSYYYQIVEIDDIGDRVMHGPVAVHVGDVPEQFDLKEAYPNPFNPSTTIRYSLAADSDVQLEVYNMIGQKVKTLVAERQNAGVYQVQWDGMDDLGNKVAGGAYLYRIKAGTFSATKRITFIK